MAVKISQNSIVLPGQIVRYHRRRGGMSRVQLAPIAGVGKTVVYDIENGKATVRLKTLLAVLETLDLKVGIDDPFTTEFEKTEDAKS